MKKFLFSCVLLLSMFCFAQKQIFESPNLYTEISHHKTIAILPFTCKITYKKQPKNFSAEANKDQEESMATSIQQSLYTFLLRKNDDYFVTFQDADKTNILLKKANVFDKLDELTKDEIAKILGVDAIISGNYESHQSKSNGAAITTAVLFGGFGGKTGSGTLTLLINNGLDGELLWRFFKTM
ncbi:MAG: hypothetical protein Q8J97_04195, partial [Flavobacteriaceae bacterium]|nr:hypothetical protein [Flavobacteriaceae bacterium]